MAALLKEAFPTRQGDSHPPKKDIERRAEDPPFSAKVLVRNAGEMSTQSGQNASGKMVARMELFFGHNGRVEEK